MIYEYTISNKAPALEKTRGVWTHDVVEWSNGSIQADTLTTDEMRALQAKHGTSNVNFQRATQVKRLMIQGHNQARIISALRPNGRGFQERMIKADHAALSGCIKKQLKKVQ